MRHLQLALAAAVLAALPGVRALAAAPKPAPKKVAVVASGPEAATGFDALKRGLKGFTLVRVPESDPQKEASRWGVALGTDAAYQALALGMKASAVIRLSTFARADGSVAAGVQLRDGATGAMVDDATWRAKNSKALATTLAREARPRFGKALAKTRVPPPNTRPRPPPGTEAAAAPAAGAAAGAAAAPAGAPGTTPVPVPPPPGATAVPPASAAAAGPSPTEPSAERRRRVVLDLALGGGVFSRSLTYKDDLFDSLNGYSLGVSANLALQLQWYPFAAGEGFLGNIGLVGAFNDVPGLTSQAADGTSFPTTAYGWEAGFRVRFPFGEASEVGLLTLYEAQVFRISGSATTPKPNIPDVNYGVIAVLVDGRFAIGSTFSILARVGYGFVLHAGEITSSTYFPRASVGCFQGGLGVGIAFSRLLELRVMGDIRRYFYSFNPQPGDPVVAGGAVDQYLTGTAFLAFRF